MLYHYPNISYDGFSNALIVDNELYMLPKGHADKLDYGKVIPVFSAFPVTKLYGTIMDLESDSYFLCEFNLMEDTYKYYIK